MKSMKVWTRSAEDVRVDVYEPISAKLTSSTHTDQMAPELLADLLHIDSFKLRFKPYDDMNDGMHPVEIGLADVHLHRRKGTPRGLQDELMSELIDTAVSMHCEDSSPTIR